MTKQMMTIEGMTRPRFKLQRLKLLLNGEGGIEEQRDTLKRQIKQLEDKLAKQEQAKSNGD